jgi:hypothetical protein
MGLTKSLGALPKVLTVSGSSIGVGTTSPTLGNLQLSNTNGVTLAIKNTTGITTGTEFSQLTFNSTSNANANFESAKIKVVSTNGGANLSNLIFENSGNEHMRISSDGKVGIGEDDPSTKTHIAGASATGGVLRIDNSENQEDVNHGTLNLVNTKTHAIGNDASIMFSGKDSSGTIHPRASIGMKVSSNSVAGDLVFNTRSDSSYEERMRIMAGGTLLVGGTNDSAGGVIQAIGASGTRLSIRSTSSGGNQPGLRFFHDGNDEFVIAGGYGLKFFSSGANERMSINFDGSITNIGVKTQYASGFSSTALTFHVDFPIITQSTYKVVAGISHWTTAYGAYREIVQFNNTYSDISVVNIIDHNTPNGGAWELQKPNSTTLRVRHVGGSYDAYGNWWIQVIGNQ